MNQPYFDVVNSLPLCSRELLSFKINEALFWPVTLEGHTAGFRFRFRFRSRSSRSWSLMDPDEMNWSWTHTELWVIWVLSCDMQKSDGQLEILISPLSFMFPTQSGSRGRDSLLSVLTLIHAAGLTSAHTHFDLQRKHKSFMCTSAEIILDIISPVKTSAAPPLIGSSSLFHISVSWMQSDSSVRQRKLLYFYYQSTRWRHGAAVKWRGTFPFTDTLTEFDRKLQFL